VLSPHGATFLLARLQADGPAAAVIRARCPDAGWYLCAFADRLPMDANDFLWVADSPVNRAPDGTPRFLGGALLSDEAGRIVAETLRADPVAVARAILHNTIMQLVTPGLGDTLGAENLAAALRPRIAEGFPPRELAAYDAALQSRGELRATVMPIAPVTIALLLAALPLLVVAAWRALRARDGMRAGLMAAIIVGVVGNAAATGGLSGVFPRYQARIAWLLPVGAVLLLLPRRVVTPIRDARA
jgi:heme A synthase